MKSRSHFSNKQAKLAIMHRREVPVKPELFLLDKSEKVRLQL